MKTNDSEKQLFADRSGSVILGAMAVLAITLVFVGTALSTALHGFRASHHSSRWTQALHAAEAGAEIGLMTAQKDSWTTDGWSGAPGTPGDSPVTKTVTLSTGVPATGPITADVSVDMVDIGGDPWLRIRSTGNADLSGGAAAGFDTRDTLLRKLSLRRDRNSGSTLSTPRATRAVEVLAAPRASHPFKYTFVSKEKFDIPAQTTSDSYDSSDPNKSNFAVFGSYGVYDLSKKQTNGDVATTDSTHTWNLYDATIWGDVYTPSGDLDHTANVHGSLINPFGFNYPDEVSPDWTTVTQNHGALDNSSTTLTGGTEASPTRHKFSSINLSNDNMSIRVHNPAGQSESWVEIWVTGDTFIDAKSNTGVTIDPGVHATLYFGSRVEVRGGTGSYAIRNESMLPSRLMIHAYGGSSGIIEDFIFKGADFWGVVSAPWYKVKFDVPDQEVSGSFLTWQFDISDRTMLHYDEALASLEIRQSFGYSVRSWVEAVR